MIRHLSQAELIAALDEELSGSEATSAEAHLAECDQCMTKYRELGALSVRLESMVSNVPVSDVEQDRDRLATALAAVTRRTSRSNPVLWYAGFAAAAALAVAITYTSHGHSSASSAGHVAVTFNAPEDGPPQTLQVGGETFVALPYSNAELPLSSSHIVQMQVPVASLVSAGIVFEPISNQAGSPDRAVLADVLLGIDGEPRGVHILNAN